MAKKDSLLNEERLKMILAGSDLGYWDWNIETGEVKRNEHWARMLGYPTMKEFEENIDTWTKMVHPDDRDAVWSSINDHLEGRTTAHKVEYRMLSRDGSYKWILDHAKIVQRDSNGKPLRMCGTHIDLTSRKQVESEREKLLHDMRERVKELQCMYGVAGSIQSRENLEEIFQDVVNLIPPGWHYPAITRAKIVYEGKEYVSEPFEETEWKQSCDVLVKNKPVGLVEVYYLEECPELDEGPFMTEERNLLNSIAQSLGEAIHRKQTEENFIRTNLQLKAIIESEPECVKTVSEDGSLLSMNPAGLNLVEASSFDEVDGISVYDLIAPEHRDNFIDLNKCVFEGSSIELEFEIIGLKGGRKWVETHATPLTDETGRIIAQLAVTRDITERKHVEEQLSHQASHDVLTELVNRREFERRAKRLITTVKYDEVEHALCYLDLDLFKVVNDTCGHSAGDELLRQLSSVLKNIVRKRDTLARLGGDEFGVLMEHCSPKEANRLAVSIQKAVQNYHFIWEGRSFKVSVSIGLVPITDTTISLTELLKNADAACYMAKDKGRNRIHVLQSGDKEIAQHRGEMQLVTQINQALEEDRFCFYVQGIVPLNKGADKHYELLIRMVDEKGGLILPVAFLPAAERYNLISKLDNWVIKNAFELVAQNPAFLEQTGFISINLSGPSMTEQNFLDVIIEQMNISGIEKEKICFEITETAAISNLGQAIKFISTLKGIGCRFALDDFGSGLSSFAYLKNLPVDYLKIDGMFVKDIVDDPIDHAMVKSINEIGQVMGMKTIAEFVENTEIKNMLRELGVTYAQGYGIEKPFPLEELLSQSNNDANIANTNHSI